MAKLATAWVVNPNYAANLYVYDSATFKYDAVNQTYDGVATGQSPISTRPLTTWTTVG